MTDHRTTHATVAVSPCVTSLVARSYQVLTFYSCQTVVFVLFQGWQKYILHTSAGCVRQPGSSILASYHRWSVQPVAFVALYSKICCAIACWNHWVRWRIKTVTNHCEKKVSSDTKMMNRDVCSISIQTNWDQLPFIVLWKYKIGTKTLDRVIWFIWSLNKMCSG